MKKIWIFATLALMVLSASCKLKTNVADNAHSDKVKMMKALKDTLQSVAEEYPGEIGIALLTDCGDTVVVNNENKYPLMSVFKLHQAISLCRYLEENGMSLDSIVSISRHELNPDTWSPMLKDYGGNEITVPVRRLLEYTLMQSDNNASNYMFDKLQAVGEVDRFIATVIPRESFSLSVTEADMWDNHHLCYENRSTPLGAALLIKRLFTDSILGEGERDFICDALGKCKTGTDRIAAPLAGKEGVAVAHKTGSGFRNAAGILSAHNDVAFVTLPGGRNYTLSVLVKDFHGTESEAAAVISRISAMVYASVDSLYRNE